MNERSEWIFSSHETLQFHKSFLYILSGEMNKLADPHFSGAKQSQFSHHFPDRMGLKPLDGAETPFPWGRGSKNVVGSGLLLLKMNTTVPKMNTKTPLV